MGNYYFLAPSLPPLELGGRPDITSYILKIRMEENLGKKDLEASRVIRTYIDINNIRALLLEEPIDLRGNLNEKELDEALLLKVVLPEYIFDFLGRYDTASERIKNFSGLLVQFFFEEIPKSEGFLNRYLSFEREWRLVLIGLRAKHLGRDVAKELQFEDFTDPLVAQILAQKDAETYEPPVEYAGLKELFIASGNDPWQQNKSFAEWRFEKIELLVERPLFSIDWILSYMVQLMIVEDWNELDREKGRMILDTFKSS